MSYYPCQHCPACKHYPCICYEQEIARAKLAGESRARFKHEAALRVERQEKARLRAFKRKLARAKLMEELPPNPTQEQVWADIHRKVRNFYIDSDQFASKIG